MVLFLAFAAVAVLGAAAGIGGTLLLTSSGDDSAPTALNPDPFTAQPGECLHAEGGNNGEFSKSAKRVACSDSAANYVVV
ncbi:hypothetical protein [Nocardia yamanashiensis]|uniref:hypothetical protein n=1 Tax=Nocardia yamanashiensis TaxID=209247 RepID=UPI0008378C94|nr:hypothetical protein [Nocardia yamanashiensis]